MPFDVRIGAFKKLIGAESTGVAILLRDDYLLPKDMRIVWEELGAVYLSSPPQPLVTVTYLHQDKAFQAVILQIGGSCDLLSLLGVAVSLIEADIKALKGDEETISEMQPTFGQVASGNGIGHYRLACALAKSRPTAGRKRFFGSPPKATWHCSSGKQHQWIEVISHFDLLEVLRL